MGDKAKRESRQTVAGTGACAEAQADGTPCVGTERNCPECALALPEELLEAENPHCPECESPIVTGDW